MICLLSCLYARGGALCACVLCAFATDIADKLVGSDWTRAQCCRRVWARKWRWDFGIKHEDSKARLRQMRDVFCCLCQSNSHAFYSWTLLSRVQWQVLGGCYKRLHVWKDTVFLNYFPIRAAQYEKKILYWIIVSNIATTKLLQYFNSQFQHTIQF